MEFFYGVAAIYAGMGLIATIFTVLIGAALILAILFEKIELITSFTVIALFGAYFYEPTSQYFDLALLNWDTVLAYVAGWFVVGGLWSVFKLWRYSAKLSRVFEQFKLTKLKGISIANLETHEKNKLRDEIDRYMRCHTKYGEGYPTQLSNIKGTITGWIMYWPLSAILYLVDEPIKRAVLYIYERLGGIYNRIINRYTASYREQMSELQ